MQRKGTTDLPLHTGKCPSWLFKDMKELVGKISKLIVLEYSERKLLEKLSDPFFFQALGCTVSFDWHSSGLTTTLTGALKESINEMNLDIKVAGGKGKNSRKTPKEILDSKELCNYGKLKEISRSSKMSAKVDSTCLQDDYKLYHHCTMFSDKGDWIVIQQGMNEKSGYARRYHWLSNNLGSYIEEPHNEISSKKKEPDVIDLTSKKSKENRKTSVDLVNDGVSHFQSFLTNKNQSNLDKFLKNEDKISFPPEHEVIKSDFSKKIFQNINKAYEKQPSDFKDLISTEGIGPKTVRALALISDLVYGEEYSKKDPATYSYAHGGKDGTPYPVNEERYQKSINFLKRAIQETKIEEKEKRKAMNKLSDFVTQE
ncbi:MAG: hypothetical protein BTN85_0473 [Candidatus Methanohalarchaeum thermophilum]|uniref:DUF763 domain-containing protein n=1 Tax=Methanohalarchaeum thermophilum TaxID=1903181 RepID=A0A1Q6DUG6_METT1|nr:MAG: hypothetical protein BTN85_0473 [Candidatus Methanohalarchaeum thermophilum]